MEQSKNWNLEKKTKQQNDVNGTEASWNSDLMEHQSLNKATKKCFNGTTTQSK